MNIRMIICLDDMLLMSHIIEGLKMARDTLIFLLQHLVFIINLKKYLPSPIWNLEFLGLELESMQMTLTLPEINVKKLISEC